jgi:hypothetical protein
LVRIINYLPMLHFGFISVPIMFLIDASGQYVQAGHSLPWEFIAMELVRLTTHKNNPLDKMPPLGGLYSAKFAQDLHLVPTTCNGPFTWARRLTSYDHFSWGILFFVGETAIPLLY